MPTFHVCQSSKAVWAKSVENNHWQTEGLLFELLNKFLTYRSGNSIPPEVREYINVCDLQVRHVSGLKQATEDNAQPCGNCLVRATGGHVVHDRSLSFLSQSGHTISILTVPETEECGCTFGVVVHGVYIGLWCGHHSVHWRNCSEAMDLLAQAWQQDVFQVLHHVFKVVVNEQHLLRFDGVAVVPKGWYPIDLRCLVSEQHDEFIRARKNLEAIECMRREEIVAATSIVCGTSGVLMQSNLKSKCILGAVVGALVIDESSMPEGGEELCKLMDLILGRSCDIFFVGDLCSESA